MCKKTEWEFFSFNINVEDYGDSSYLEAQKKQQTFVFKNLKTTKIL